MDNKHVWIDGPDGQRYHCPVCGISKCDDYGQYDTCESYVKFLGRRYVSYDGYIVDWQLWLASQAAGDGEMDLIEYAWGIIANVNGGDWGEQSLGWNTAAENWRDRYHELLDSLPKSEEVELA